MAPKQLGRYHLERKLATGGMAEIWVAHQQGPAGFAKEVVVKKILPHLAEDPKFIEMFLDEARLAARLSHPNIVQIFELGDDDGQYFIAMEFIDGRDVQVIVDRCIEIGRPFAPAIAARIVADACTALDYAHNFTERDGTHVQLVHRDVSPQNILVSNDGIVKLVDFGVAKAATSTHKTQTGAVKGKLSYMSPEQISGKVVDARSDIFALGIVLYELVTGRRPFGHESELLAITAILNENPTRPCEVIGDLPLELEAVILKALEKDPARRFQSASEMQIALEQVLRHMGAILTAREVRAYLDDLFSANPTGTIPALSGIHTRPAGAVTRPEHPSATTRPDLPEGSDRAGAGPGTLGGVAQPGGAWQPGSGSLPGGPAPHASGNVYLQGALASAAVREYEDEPSPPSSRRGVVLALLGVLVLLFAGAAGLYAMFGPGADAPSSEAAEAGGPDARSAGATEQAPSAADASGLDAASEPSADAVAVVDAPDPDSAEGSGAAGAKPPVALDAGDEVAAVVATPDSAPDAPAEIDASTAATEVGAESGGADAAGAEAGGAPERAPERPPEQRPEPARNGTIHVVVSGGSGEIFIDGRSVGRYPGNTRFEVSAGSHSVRVVPSSGAPYSQTVRVDGGGYAQVRVR